MRLTLLFFVVLFSCFPFNVFGFTINMNFNNGVEGASVRGAGGFTSDAGSTYFSKEKFFEGGQAAQLNATKGAEGFGSWGGVTKFPVNLGVGSEIWIRVRTFWPQGVTYDANPRLKFLRVRTEKLTSTGGYTNAGYNDWYINQEGSARPFLFIKEAGYSATEFGGASDKIQRDKWETYEFYLKLDSVPVSRGGQARALMWKNGKLIGEIADSITLTSSSDIANGFYLFTYWNHDPFQKLMELSSVANFQVGEIVTGVNDASQYTVVSINGTDLVLGDSRRVSAPSYQAGETIRGLTSNASAVVSSVKFPRPSADVVMYVDDIVITNEIPDDRDAAGNPFIGDGRPGRINTIQAN